MSTTDLQSTTAFRELINLLRDADQTFLEGPRGEMDDINRVAGYRSLTHLLRYACELYLEADAQRPSFASLAGPTCKILGDNVDSRYFFAPLTGSSRYRIRGRRGDEVYLAFCVYGGKPDGEWSERVIANLSQRDLQSDGDGSFEILLTPAPRPTAARNWICLEPDAVCVISREYYTDPRTARPASLAIEALEPVAPPAPSTDAEMAAKLRAVATFVRQSIEFAPIPPLPVVNDLLPPMPWSPSVRGWGTPDNIYALGTFRLEPDEALLIEGSSPRCVYWGVQVWNRYMQSLDYRHYRVSLNHTQVDHAADGSWRIAIAQRDPGVPNWISTAGYHEGLFFCRWLQAQEPPEPPRCSVVKIGG